MEKIFKKKLSKDKVEAGRRYFNRGRYDGFELSLDMNIDDLIDAAWYGTTNSNINGKSSPAHNPFKDPYFGDFLKVLFDANPEFEWDGKVPNYYFRAFEDGLFTGFDERLDLIVDDEAEEAKEDE